MKGGDILDIYKKTSHRLTEFLIANEAMEKEKQEIYDYGLELLFASFVNLLVVFLIGVVFDRVLETILFIIVFSPIRMFAGGYHASNHFTCGLMFNMFYMCIILIEKHLWNETPLAVMIISSLAVGIIFLLAPVEDNNKPLSKRQVKLFRKTARIIAGTYLVGIIVGLIMFPQAINYIAYVAMALIGVTLLITIGYLNKRKET